MTIFGAACNLRYPDLGCCNENLLITCYYLNPDFYRDSTWAQFSTQIYKPYAGIADGLQFNNTATGTTTTMNFNNLTTYDESVSYSKGWFQSLILKANQIKKGSQVYDATPCGVLRYNPKTDSGKGNKMWLTSILTDQYKVPSDNDLIMEDYPMWLMLYGYTSFFKTNKKRCSILYRPHTVC